MSKNKEKKQLIEEIGLRMEERLGISPLAARIYALLTLTLDDGLTFEEIRETIDASKSSTSVNVNVLLQLGYIEYFTKSGDRKRYFKVAKYFQLESLELYHQSLEKEIELVDQINTYHKENYSENSVKGESLGDITKEYLRTLQHIVKDTIQKISRFRESDK